ncbi:c-type cytochrome [Legionella sp. CNM-4043-24]|uniref:c-type cytochrome n=1 Tax=Legionella sp. CNM-4043-24 TaxID=3421646 RepID=UPI00403B1D8A
MKKTACVVLFMLSFGVQATEPSDKIPEAANTCVACHGPQGNSSNPEWPNLAGQHAQYLLKQLKDFKAGKTRNAASMTAMVASLSEDDMKALASYYSRLPLAENITPRQYLQRGEQLYRGGDFDKHITACIACHGPQGTGNNLAGFPVLSGQNAAYTIQQLQAFKDKIRHNDMNNIMQDISARMDKSDMEAVAWYVQGLH